MRTAEPPAGTLPFFRIALHLLYTQTRVIQMPLHCGLFQFPWGCPPFQFQYFNDLTHTPLRHFPFQLYRLCHDLIEIFRQPLVPPLFPSHGTQAAKTLFPVFFLIPVQASLGYPFFTGCLLPQLAPFPFIHLRIQQRCYQPVTSQRFFILPAPCFFLWDAFFS